MIKRKLIVAGLLTIAALPASAVDRGELLANSCFSCHGYDGKATGGAIPPLGEYPASLIVSQMKAYRDGTRNGTIMNRHARGYTDEEIELLAKYIGKQGI
ncbi:cytochrome C [Thiomicrorhabdus sp. zzn3]|uniref:c-type cytochrome n=1 Tax=Thiomicrorhabdus sp. zzn3 TaxID=3039775 RepID=UPI0024364713|nr:c-type cytochrome [Thiomicrorhabdus sp. zzn3]MDG6777765.1 cytochrome C [Thiomicrorhabdus sp. zzn3]